MIEFTDAIFDVLVQNKTKKCLKLSILPGKDAIAPNCYALRSGNRSQGESDVGQHVEYVAVLGIEHPADLSKLLAAKTAFGQPLE